MVDHILMVGTRLKVLKIYVVIKFIHFVQHKGRVQSSNGSGVKVHMLIF